MNNDSPINSISTSGNVYNLIKEGLSAASERSKVIANNIANVNTKAYKRFYVTFEENLNNENSDFSMKRTNSKHISDVSSSGDTKVLQDTTSSMREDGNNVDIETEKVNQAANELMYDTLANLASMNLSMKRHVINEKSG